MATVEVDEEQVRRDAALRTTVQKILSNPQAKLLVQQAHKMVDATAVTPELDQQTQISAPLETVNKQLSELQKQIEADKAARADEKKLLELQKTVDAGFAKLRQQRWTDDGIAAVKKIMEEKGLLDPLDAAAIFERDHPPQNPVQQQGSGAWNFMEVPSDDADFKRLIETKGESEPLINKMAHDALNEVRGTPRR